MPQANKEETYLAKTRKVNHKVQKLVLGLSFLKSKSFPSFKWVMKVKNDFQNKRRKLYAWIWQPSVPSPNPFKSKEQSQSLSREMRILKDIKFPHILENYT